MIPIPDHLIAHPQPAAAPTAPKAREDVPARLIAEALRPGRQEKDFAEALRAGCAAISAQGHRRGLTTAVIAGHRLRFASALTVAHILGLARSAPDLAAEFYRVNAALVPPEMRRTLDLGLASAQEDAQIQRAAGGILAGQPVAEAGMSGIPATDPDPVTHLPAWLAEADRFAAHTRPGEDGFRRRLRREVTGRVAAIRAAQSDYARRRRNLLLAAALGSGRRLPITLPQLTADPAVHLAWTAAPPDLREAVERRIGRNRAGSEPESGAEARLQAQRALGMHLAHPEGFRRADLSRLEGVPAARHLRLVKAQEQPPGEKGQLLHQLLTRMALRRLTAAKR